MTDDIVTRLLIPLPYNLAGMTTKQLSDERREAVDEIERLRTERDHYKRIAEEAVSNLEQAVKLLQAFQAAVHD